MMTAKFSQMLLFILILTFSNTAFLLAQDNEWRGWRGPNSDFQIQSDLVLTGDEEVSLEIVWKKPLGSGYSPVSVGDGLAVTMFSDNTFDYVIALDIKNGSDLWRFRVDSTFLGRFGSIDGGISTPLITNETIIALHSNGRLVALNPKSGELSWETHLVADHGSKVPFYGYTTSPLLYKNTAIVLTGGSDDRTVTAFDIATGKVKWTKISETIDYQSPGIHTVSGKEQFIFVASHSMFGLSPDNGEILWEFPHGSDGEFRGVTCANLIEVKPNTFFFKDKGNSTGMFEIKASADSFSVNELWRSNHIKQTYVVPVSHNGLVFGYNTRIFTAVDAETGERVWRSRAPGDGFPIVINDYLVVGTKDGHLSVAPVSREGYNETARLKVFDDLIWSNPSYSDKCLYIRSAKEIACVEIVPKTTIAKMDQDELGKVSKSEFAKFVHKVEQAENKAGLVDEFVKSQKSFPVIEGDNLVHFVYHGDADDMGIAGDLQGFRFDSPMHRIGGTNLFYYSAQVEEDARLNYGFIKNLKDNISDPLNTTWGAVTEATSWFSMPKWQRPEHLTPHDDVKKGRLDSLQYTSKLADTTLTIPVYLPNGYDDGAKTYPVAYIHLGSRAIALGNVPTSLDNIIGKTVEPVVVVFLPVFISGRLADYAQFCGWERENYYNAFTEEMIPLVEKTYRVKSSPNNRANIGHHRTSFMAVYSTLNKPGFFGKLGLQQFYRDNKDFPMIQSLMPTAGDWLTDIYLDWGKYDWRSPNEGAGSDGISMSKTFARLLNEKGYKFAGGQVNDGRGWSSWQNRTDKLFEALFPLQPE